MKQPVTINKVLALTPGKNHAWCDSNVGLIRKPLNSIPKELLMEKGGDSIGQIHPTPVGGTD